nr:MAG TPA: hypothetical protein [Bacteriophage sp.]
MILTFYLYCLHQQIQPTSFSHRLNLRGLFLR